MDDIVGGKYPVLDMLTGVVQFI